VACFGDSGFTFTTLALRGARNKTFFLKPFKGRANTTRLKRRLFLKCIDGLHSALFNQSKEEEFHRGLEFVSFRENLDTAGPLGRAVVVIISVVAELERYLIIERVRAGIRRAKLEGRRIGRAPLEVDRRGLLRDRACGMSLTDLAKAYRISRSSVCRVLREHKELVSITSTPTPSPTTTQVIENRPSGSAA
jgi:DNA invertase Pin-like site-specific DNA recombinase